MIQQEISAMYKHRFNVCISTPSGGTLEVGSFFADDNTSVATYQAEWFDRQLANLLPLLSLPDLPTYHQLHHPDIAALYHRALDQKPPRPSGV